MSSQPTAVEDESPEPDSNCWCCGRAFPDERLVRLGTHPEAGICFQCAKYVHRRAREQDDIVRGNHGLAARGRVVFQTGRDAVVRRGWQHGRISGPVLRWINKLMP